MVKIYVQTPLKFWFHIKFSREYDYVNEYPYSAKLQNMTCWTESGTKSSHIKGLDKCVWCWVCSVLSKQRGEVVWWGGGVRFTKVNCGQESQWPYTDCGPAVTGMFAPWDPGDAIRLWSWSSPFEYHTIPEPKFTYCKTPKNTPFQRYSHAYTEDSNHKIQ